ncbi:sensor histidine kinase [Aquimarina sp. 2201CG5-10]|uniref:sensor histidine kinase n=1 Tax=Aquimarina callyspongiae TaxID=3098150 RepID=UPI002AB3AA36|nr:histidine kinase [Aquimarina sp. 2201CG5-10]MDY8134026.1 histidine kinase [Aquimarina sp. 2201CG5-10]
MISKTYIKKFLFRFLIINIVYFIIKLTINPNDYPSNFDEINIFYYTSAFFLFMFTWESNDWLIKKEIKTNPSKGLDLNNGLKILGMNMLIYLPISAILYYLAIFEFNHICKIDVSDPWLRFRIDFFRAAILGFAVIIFNLFYYSLKQKKELENTMNKLKKEVITSKYKSLKSQISPHFLFNSLNTLTSLMYEDRDLASDFVSRLASCYRYILDNREEDLVSLHKELNFLDSFIFMMNIRHEGALTITTHISTDTEAFVIPTLSLQMLVENALKHNYFSKEKPLDISIYSIDKTSIVVQNNLHVRPQQEESTKLGLKNIKKRYSFYTNQKVLIETENGYFKITLPLLPKNIKEMTIVKVS